MSTTCTTELQPIEAPAPARIHTKSVSDPVSYQPSRRSSPSHLLAENGSVEPNPTPVVEVAQKWNETPTTAWRVGATFWSLLVMGANDAAYGVK